MLGRSPDCHVTIEDPLVSREHARLHLRGERAFVEDLGSRNGTRLNGKRVRGTHELADGDRIRIGGQEVVFSVSGEQARGGRSTGLMVTCADCFANYPSEIGGCPRCGSHARTQDDTVHDQPESAGADWPLQLLVEVLQRAETARRGDEAARAFERVRLQVENQLAARQPVRAALLDGISVCVARLAREGGERAAWAEWLLQTHIALQLPPPEVALNELMALPESSKRRLASLGPVLLRVFGAPAPELSSGLSQTPSVAADPARVALYKFVESISA